jgi:diadenosine tetraphosphate (Ap4A) HIT family hydrolase
MTSPFLQLPPEAHVASNALAFAIRDGFPVSAGHTLIVPRRLVATWFEATREEQVAMLELIDVVKAQLDAELQPDGYNIGINAGAAAGQTVMHLHMHLIPRFAGDVPDPRGGIRHVIPGAKDAECQEQSNNRLKGQNCLTSHPSSEDNRWRRSTPSSDGWRNDVESIR